MKKSKIFLLGIILVLSVGVFTACGKGNDGSDGSTAGSTGSMESKAHEIATDVGSKAHEIATDAGKGASEIVTDIGNGIENIGDVLEGSTPAHK